MSGLAVAHPGDEPVRQEHAEEGHEEGAQEQEERLVRAQLDRERADRGRGRDEGDQEAL